MKNTKTNKQNIHVPVLLDAVLHSLAPEKGNAYLDLTAGYGGHASVILERTLNPKGAVLVDRDENAVGFLEDKFSSSGVQIIHSDFLSAAKGLLADYKQFDLILADLGVSSPHLDNANRGFSLKQDGPLDMRMDQRQELTADFIVNNYEESELARIIRAYGEDPKANKVARFIVENRPIHSTVELAAVVARAWPGHSKTHPATKTFQALRLAVNSELELLKQALPVWIDLLAPGGRIAVISFHSLEDRIVKQMFGELSGNRYDAILRLLTKQPMQAAADEIVFNPRARSAKLRAAAKIKTQKGE